MSVDLAEARIAPMSLRDWDLGEVVAPEYYARVMEHPAFAVAARGLAASTLATSLGADPVMRAISKDAGRYMAALGVIWLDLNGGLTLPRLKDMCVRSGLLSPGRARSFLQYLQHVGYLETVREGRAATPALYAPTARFRAAWLDHMRAPIAAAALIAPEAGVLLERLDEPATAEAFLHLQGASLLESTTAAPFSDPVFEVFYHPLGGIHLLCTLLAAEGEGFPARAPVALPISRIAADIGVSRIHLKRIVVQAVEAGMLAGGPGDGYALTARTDAMLRWFFAAQLVRLLVPIARTLAAVGAAGRGQKCSIVTPATHA